MTHQLTFEGLLDKEAVDMPSIVQGEETNSPRPTAYIFVDLETGGLDSLKHPILQIAAVITDLDLKIRGHFMSYVRSQANLEITEEALTINRLSRSDIEAAPLESQVALALKHFTDTSGGPARFAGYNCKFDLEFLDEMWKRYDLLPAPYMVPWLDIYSVTKTKFGYDSGLANLQLTTVATHLGISSLGAHDASADLIMTIEVARQLRKLPDREGAVILTPARFSE